MLSHWDVGEPDLLFVGGCIARQVAPLGIRLRTHRHVLAGGTATIDFRDGLFAIPVRRLWESP